MPSTVAKLEAAIVEAQAGDAPVIASESQKGGLDLHRAFRRLEGGRVGKLVLPHGGNCTPHPLGPSVECHSGGLAVAVGFAPRASIVNPCNPPSAMGMKKG